MATNKKFVVKNGLEANGESEFNANAAFNGESTFNANAAFGDNNKAIFGAGSDLTISHDTTGTVGSYITETGSGSLNIRGNNVIFANSDGSEEYGKFFNGAGVEFNYANATKLATTATGISVTGTLTSDGLTVDGVGSFTSDVSSDTDILTFVGTSWGDDELLSIPFNRGSNTLGKISVAAAAAGQSGVMRLYTGSGGTSTERIKIDSNGDISFYDAAGTSQKFFWDASAEWLGIGTVSPATYLHVNSGVTNNVAIFESTDGTASIRFVDGNQTLNVAIGSKGDDFYIQAGGTEKFRLASSGVITVTGDIAVTGDLSFGDNGKAIFGASSDLQIYHDGSHSVINDVGTGHLKIQGTDIRIQSSNGAENFLVADENGAVRLYNNNSQKFQTTSTGVDVTGTVAMDGGSTSADFTFGDNNKAIFGDGSDLQIYHNTHSYIEDAGTGDLILKASDQIKLQNGSGQNMAIFNENGAVLLTHSEDTKLATTSTGIAVTGNVAVTGTVDGRDVAADGTKLDGIETGATADQVGLVKGADIGGSVDLDTYTTDGYYHQNTNANAVSGTNYPATVAGMLSVQADGNKVYQKYQTYNGEGAYQRTKYNSTWYAWDKVLDSGNMGAASGLDADLLDGQHGSYYTGYTDTAVSNLVDSAPGTLDTLNELAAALGDDANFSTTVTNSIAAKLPLAGGTITGDLTVNDTLKISTNPVSTVTDLALTSQAAIVGQTNMSFGLTNDTDGYYRWMFGNTTNTGGIAGATEKMRLDKDGNLTLSGTVDGVDVAARDAILTSTTTTAGAALPKSGGTMTGAIIISASAPQIKLNDTTANADDFYLHANSNNFYVLADRGDDGSHEGPHPLQLEADTNIGFVFGSRMFHETYHPNADTLTTARTINGVSFNGSANITVADATKLPLAGGTMTGDLKISKTDAAIYLNDSSGGPSQQGMRIRAESIDTNLPGGEGTGFVFEEDPASGSPDTTPAVIATGEFYAQSNQKVFHQNYHPNADTLTIARNINGVAFDGSSNITITALDSSKLPLSGGTMTGDLTIPNKIIHAGDTNTYLQFEANDKFRVVTNSAEVQEWGTAYTLFNDNIQVRLGTGSDFRMFHNGTDTYFRNYAHSNGDVIFQGENSAGTNQSALILDFSGTRQFVKLYENGTERLKTTSTGVQVSGLVDASGDLKTATYVQGGVGSGGVALTHNDGYGNSNITFNHRAGIPEQNGVSGRIVVNTDSTAAGDAFMDFQLVSGVTSGSALPCASLFAIDADGIWLQSSGGYIHGGDTSTSLYLGDTGDFAVVDEDRTTNNIIWYDKSQNELNLGTSEVHIMSRATEWDFADADLINAGTLRLTSASDATGSSTGHAFQIGASNTLNVRIDDNEIMALTNGVSSDLYLNKDGKCIFGTTIGTDGAFLTVNVDDNDNSSAARVFRVDTNSLSFMVVNDDTYVRDNFKAGEVRETTAGTVATYTGGESLVYAFGSSVNNYAFIRGLDVADGTDAFQIKVGTNIKVEIDGDGDAFTDGTWSDAAADYAEMFEWADGNPNDEDRVGYPVVLTSENKIRKATSADDRSLIIGIISAQPAFLGDNAANKWNGWAQRDDWGREVKRDVSCVKWTKNGDGVTHYPDDEYYQYRVSNLPEGLVVPARAEYFTRKETASNPDWDADQEYTPRLHRAEWDPVGMVGKLRMHVNQPSGDRWIKMRTIKSDDDGNALIEEWLVR